MDSIFQNPGEDGPPLAGREGAHKYWAKIDPAITQVFSIMDEQDTWSIEDHDRVREMLDKVIRKMQSSKSVASYCLEKPKQALEIMAWMRSSSAMMLLHYSNEDRKEVTSRFLSACQAILASNPDDDHLFRAATLAVDRFLVFERLALLKRLFSKERTDRLEAAIHDAVSLSQIKQQKGRSI